MAFRGPKVDRTKKWIRQICKILFKKWVVVFLEITGKQLGFASCWVVFWTYIDFRNMSDPKITYILRLAIVANRSKVQHMNSTTQLQRNQDSTIIIKLEPKCPIRLNNKKAELSKADFGSVFLEAVDSTFAMLGDSNKQALYFYLENRYGISKEDIPHNIEVFGNILEQVFGQGALLLEARIMETLQSKVPHFRFSPEKDELSFLGYIEDLRSFL